MFDKPTRRDGEPIQGYVVLGRATGENTYQGIIEHSFSMALSKDRVNFFWSSKSAQSVLVNALSGRSVPFVVDGRADAEYQMKSYQKSHPDYTFEMFDIYDENLPIIIDWDDWRDGNQPADTLSGVKNKFTARNPKFYLPE